jgi:hypothetical protein
LVGITMSSGVCLSVCYNGESGSMFPQPGREDIARIICFSPSHFVDCIPVERASILRVLALNKDHLRLTNSYNVNAVVV